MMNIEQWLNPQRPNCF